MSATTPVRTPTRKRQLTRSPSSTSSPNDDGLHPELAAFARFCKGFLRLESGRPLELYPEQLVMLTDYFNGATETVIILPKKNGKSTLLAALAVFHLVTTPDAECVIAAASREQADRVLRPARGFVRRSRQLSERMRVKQREIVSRVDDGYIRILAADKDTADGVTPTLAIVDELHRQKSAELYGVFRDGLGPRDGRMVTISTAGDREISPLGEMRRAAKALPGFLREQAHSYVSSPDRSFALHEWALTRKDDLHDMKVVKSVNPAPWQTQEALRKRHDSVSTTPAQWGRFACGLWMSEEGTAVVPDEWDALAEKRLKPDGGKRYGFIDLGWKIDTTGVGVISFESNERRVILGPRALKPPVDEGDVVGAILDLQEELEPDAWVYDPNAGGQQMAQLLEKGEHPRQVERGIGPISFIEHSQSDGAMSIAAQRFEEAMRLSWIVHDGNEELRRHVLNAVKRALTGERFRYDRPSDAKGERRALYPIDLLTGVLMAHSVGVAELLEQKEERTGVAHFL